MVSGWKKIAEIVGEVQELAPEDRDLRLIEFAAGNAELLSRLRSLVSGAEDFPSILNESFDQMVTVTGVNFTDADSLVGQILESRFLIEKNLTDEGADAGGIGVVFLARDLNLMDLQVVVKILSEKALRDANIVRKFLHEKEALIKLSHPGIVRILDSGKLSDGNPFIVMEFIEGQSLRKLLESEDVLPFNLSAHIIESMADALAAAHAKGIYHRDIKPENVMLSPEDHGFDRVRLIDFGIARVTESQLSPVTDVAVVMGTPWYMAPEQFLHFAEPSPATDIYSLSVVVFEMLTGARPFKPKSTVELPLLQKEGVKVMPRQIRDEITAEVEELLLSGLEFMPENRPDSIRGFGKNLAAGLRATEPNGAIEIEKATDTLPNGTRRWTKISLMAGVITVLLVSIAAAYLVISGFASKGAREPEMSRTEQSMSGSANVPEDIPTGAAALDEPYEISYSVGILPSDSKDESGGTESETTGKDIFKTGDRFSLRFSANADGYMYAFNEGLISKGKLGFTLLYPTPKTNDGSARMLANQLLEAPRNKFDGKPGTEVIWLVWSKFRNEVLEKVKQSARQSKGRVDDEKSKISLTEFIDSLRAKGGDSFVDLNGKKVVVRGRGDAVLHRVELQHR